eukprot:scaffold705_cov402-Prasinococcus_capsulatus_cf.AAC.6
MAATHASLALPHVQPAAARLEFLGPAVGESCYTHAEGPSLCARVTGGMMAAFCPESVHSA